jgi:hypothetical protein
MTDRIKGFTVTLSNDIRDDDFQAILEAVKMIKGVSHIEPSIVTTHDHMNRVRIKTELLGDIYKLLNEIK